MMTINWQGVYPAVTTQYFDDYSINFEATKNMVDSLIKEGVDGIIALGTVGENCSHTREEKRAILIAVKEVVAGRVPVISGVAETTTQFAVEYSQMCEEVGIDGLMVLPGMVYRSSEAEAIHHYQQVARNCNLPIMIYNNPVTYGVDVSIEGMRVLAEEPTIISVKEATEDTRRISELYAAFGDRFIVFDAGGWLGSMAWAYIDDDGIAVMDYDREIVGIDGGAITVRQSLRETMKLKFPELRGMRDKDLDDKDLDTSLRTHRYVVSGDKDNPLDLSDAIADSLGYLKTVREVYVNQFGAGRAAQHILMTGGTTNPLYEYLLDMFAHSSVHLAGKRDAIYMANVRGGMVIVIDRLIADDLLPEPYQSIMER